ncbi:MntP/YtaF family protein [Paenibacillus sp. JX-17]|uniref:MntP/YtaF family protein n=1 Tax=Paenibacillus lacisoli TaxID=3064525 RepID=A0ABT9CA12_9BACL|nr:MntP/YtaF family protein [Paenibacillus sp. JX-17]MDO7906094.1 MntP/YtaF family protein [Paenibacillus sp. JX-17]
MSFHWVSLLVLAFALSLDSFGVGVTYGLRKLKIPLMSIIIISLCSGLVIGISMQVGKLMTRFISPEYTSWIGAFILIGIGCWSLIQPLLRQGHHESESARNDSAAEVQLMESDGKGAREQVQEMEPRQVYSLEIRKWGIVIQILRSPSAADMDDSGSISAMEAMWLGIALSLDAFGAGLGAAMLGYSPVLTSLCITLFGGVFLVMGMKTGFRFSALRSMRMFGVVPALLLIIMGIMKLL